MVDSDLMNQVRHWTLAVRRAWRQQQLPVSLASRPPSRTLATTMAWSTAVDQVRRRIGAGPTSLTANISRNARRSAPSATLDPSDALTAVAQGYVHAEQFDLSQRQFRAAEGRTPSAEVLGERTAAEDLASVCPSSASQQPAGGERASEL
jgi:hypothetical protein